MDKRDFLAFLELVKSIPGMDKIQIRILEILERDSGKIWSDSLKQECVDPGVPIENNWKEILKSPDNPNPYEV